MDKSEKRFERDIESFLISPEGGYIQFCGQDTEGNWVHTRQHDISRCIYMDVLCEFIAKTQPKEWAKYTKYYGTNAEDKLYHRLETTISNQGLLYVLRNGIEDMGCKLKVCFFKPESELNPIATERYEANILGCTRQFRYSTANTNTIDMVLSVNGIPIVGVVPAIKTAGQLSRKRKIALLATPGTVQRAYTQRLIDNFAADCEVLRLGTVDLVWLAEQCLLDEVTAAHRAGLGATAAPRLQLPSSKLPELKAILAPITTLKPEAQPDVVVLGCTHFPLLRDDIATLLGPSITLVDSGAAIGRRVAYVLAQKQESLEVEPGYYGAPAGAGDQLMNTVSPGAWVAWYTGTVSEDKRAQFAATFSYFGFAQVQELTLL